jgi:hypothetical protein
MTTPISESKMGIHLETVWHETELNALAKSGARIFVVINEFKYAQRIHMECPDATIFFRHYDLGEWLAQELNRGADPTETGKEWCRRISPFQDAMPWAIFIGTNEVQAATPEGWARLAEMDMARISYGADCNLRVAFGGFGVGHPTNEQWSNFKAAYAPVFTAASIVNNAGGTAVYHYHEYSAGIISLYYPPNSEGNVDAGNITPYPTTYEDGDLTCHYRKVYRELVQPHGYNVPFACTEFGNDYIGSPAAHKQFGITRGWNTCGSATRFSSEASNELRFINCCSWYDAQIRADEYVIGAVVFTWNVTDSKWETFRMNDNGIETLYLSYLKNPVMIITVPVKPGTTTPPVEPPVTPPSVPGPNLAKNPSFEDGSTKLSGDWDVPVNWDVYSYASETGDLHVEIEQHPPHVLDGQCSGRVWQSWSKRRMGLCQDIEVEPGATYELEASALAWATNDAQVGNPSTGRIEVRFAVHQIDGSIAHSPWFTPMDTYETERVQFKTSSDVVEILLEAWPIDAMQRTDVFFDKVSFRKVKDADPMTPPPVQTTPPFLARVKAGVRLNFRQDANADTSANIWRVLDGGTELDVWQSSAYVATLKANKAGWACVKVSNLVGFVATSYCDWL